MLFPRPLSARQVVRRNLARIVAESGDLYGKVLSGIEDEAESGDGGNVKSRGDRNRAQLLKILVSATHDQGSELMRGLGTNASRSATNGFCLVRPDSCCVVYTLTDDLVRNQDSSMTAALNEDGVDQNSRGPWPKKSYAELIRIEGQVLASLALLSVAYARLEPVWCKRLAERSDVMHPAFVSYCPTHIRQRC